MVTPFPTPAPGDVWGQTLIDIITEHKAAAVEEALTAGNATYGTPKLDKTEAAATYARQSANTIVIMGDSITAQNSENADYTGAGYGQLSGSTTRGYWTNAATRLGHRMKLLANAGISSETAQQIAARVPSVIALNPGWVVVEAGRNSVITNNDTAATIKAVLKDNIYTPFRAAGVRVIATTITPRDTDSSSQRQTLNDVNAWIKEYARATPGMVLVDFYGAVTDTTTPAFKAGYAYDGLHPSTRGAGAMGKVLADALDPLMPAVDTLLTNNADTGNLTVNGLMTGTAGTVIAGLAPTLTGPIASNWTIQGGFTGTVTAAKVVRADGKPGEWQQFTFTNTGTNRLQVRPSTSMTTGWAVGDKVYAEIEFETDAGFIPSLGYFGIIMFCFNGTTGSVSVVDNYNTTGEASGAENRFPKGSLRTPLMTIPAGTTYIQPMFQVAGSGGAVRFSRFSVRKEVVL